jgi:hypothetical protein
VINRMTRNPIAKSRPAACPRSASRRGTGTMDLLVSFTLLLTAISVVSPLVVRHGRMLKSQRNYRLALDELSNQMDRLTMLPIESLPQAIKQLSPSVFLSKRLPGSQLSGELQSTELGTRVTLKLSWNETERARAPVSLAAWVFRTPAQSAKSPAERITP